MYAKEIIFGIGLYEILFAAAIVAALVVFAKYTTKKGMPYKVQSFYLNISMAAIMAGYLSAFLFQAAYNYFESGEFVFKGVTFLGGLVGGAAAFLIGYFAFAKPESKKYFPLSLEAAPCAIMLAHAIGRVGCFFAGCCHGIETDSVFGMVFPARGHGKAVYPTQLYESIFLFGMFALSTWLFFKDVKGNLPLYLVSYGVFRFLIEFIRGDDRGKFIISFLSPSQTQSLLLIVCGAVLYFFMLRKKARQSKE